LSPGVPITQDFGETVSIVHSNPLQNSLIFLSTVLIESSILTDSSVFEHSRVFVPQEPSITATEPAQEGVVSTTLTPAIIGVIAAVCVLVVAAAVVIGIILYRRREAVAEEGPVEDEVMTFTEHPPEELECENPLAASDSMSVGSVDMSSDPDEQVSLP
jgi:hypothetical protein